MITLELSVSVVGQVELERKVAEINAAIERLPKQVAQQLCDKYPMEPEVKAMDTEVVRGRLTVPVVVDIAGYAEFMAAAKVALSEHAQGRADPYTQMGYDTDPGEPRHLPIR